MLVIMKVIIIIIIIIIMVLKMSYSVYSPTSQNLVILPFNIITSHFFNQMTMKLRAARAVV
jgi:hypothetical protein